MTGMPRVDVDPRRMTQAIFVRWVQNMGPASLKVWTDMYGKPIVRVPVERQTPNEADL